MTKKNNVVEIKKNEDKPSKILDREVAQELVDRIKKMVDDRDKKCDQAKTQLRDQLKITADKYRTATGTMEALRVLRMVNDGKPSDMEIFEELAKARTMAADMVKEVSTLVKRAEDLGWAEMDKLCEGAYEEDFVSKEFSAFDLAFELMRLDLCRNVGPAAEDMVEFQKRADNEINETIAKLNELCEKHPEFKKLTPTKED